MPTSSQTSRIGKHGANVLRVGSVTLAWHVFEPTEGLDFEFPALVAMVSHGPTCEVRWRATEGDDLRTTVICLRQAIVGHGEPPISIKCKATTSAFAFGMDEAFVGRIHQDVFGDAAEWTVERLIGIIDPIIERFCTLGQEEFDRGGARGRLYAEALGTALTVHLLGNYGSAHCVAKTAKARPAARPAPAHHRLHGRAFVRGSGGEPVLSILLWGGVLPAQASARPQLVDALAQADWLRPRRGL